MMGGGTQTEVAATNLVRMGKFRRCATERRARRTAAAPSETYDALPKGSIVLVKVKIRVDLPACVDPSFVNAGLRVRGISDFSCNTITNPSSESTRTSF